METAVADEIGPPSKALWARELLAWPEFGTYLATMPLWGLVPRGDGHPVLVLPGLVQSDLSTGPMRGFLTLRGYRSSGWGQGRNTGRTSFADEALRARLSALHAQHGRKVSLIGWSMGGLFARDLARQMPEAVRQVITLGSPFAGPAKASNAWRLYELLSGERAGDPAVTRRFRGRLDVPTTSIYSRRDGIVAWQCCLDDDDDRDGARPHVENIEVVSTHCGMGHHPAVLYAVADRLRQREDEWRPFKSPAAARWMYPGS
jgi:pimeloyl-ACP methyl ester carboxylesterase